MAKGIPCQQKGYILRGKIKDASGNPLFRIYLVVTRVEKSAKIFSVLFTTYKILWMKKSYAQKNNFSFFHNKDV